MNELTVRVARRIPLADEICGFDLVAANDGPLPSFSAGAHIDVHVAPGLVRQYSLCSDPANADHYRIAVLREKASRGGSAGMHDQVRVGDTLRVSPPRNHFALTAGTRSLLIAGGIGVTPILAMAQSLQAMGGAFALHYCGRTVTGMAFLDELDRAPFASNVQVHTDDTSRGQPFDAQRVLAKPGPGDHLYVCGPAGFMNHVLDTARRVGWADSQLHREYFAAPAAAGSPGTDQPFTIQLASTGQSIPVSTGQSALEALLAHGVDVPVSCESGVCGTCLTRVLQGTPDHRDTFLTDAERAANDQFTPCCSRALSAELVLDL